MIVIMRIDCSQDEISRVASRIEDAGLKAYVPNGGGRIVVAVVGQSFPGLRDSLESLPGVEQVILVSKPYKLASREFHPQDTIVDVDDVAVGGEGIVVIAGPCAVEGEEQLLATAQAVKAAGATVLRGGAYKPRTSPYEFRGLGEAGLRLLAQVGEETQMPVVTEVMAPEDVDLVAQYADMLQIGSRNMQNYVLLDEVGRTRKPVLLKRGMACNIQEWLLAAEYLLVQGNDQVILCERGIRTFENYARNTMDINAIPIVHKLSHLPIIADPSHATGKWYLVPPLALAAVAAGADGLLVEVHPDPDLALADGPQSLTFENFRLLMSQLRPLAEARNRKIAIPRARVKP